MIICKYLKNMQIDLCISIKSTKIIIIIVLIYIIYKNLKVVKSNFKIFILEK